MTAEQYEQVVNERRSLVANIASRSTALDVASIDITSKLAENREERLRVAKRLDQMSSHGGDRERRQRELQKELALLRKRDLYEQMLVARLGQEEVTSRVNQIEAEQHRVLLRLETAARRKQEQQDMLLRDESGARQRALDALAPALAFMGHIPAMKNIVRGEGQLGGGGDGGADDGSGGAITKALQLALRESYIKQKEDIMTRRRELTASRFELEERLDELRAQLPPEAILPEDEPFEAAFRLAESMPDHVDHAVTRINRRVIKAAEELEWLEETPDTVLWHGIRSRLDDKTSSVATLEASNLRLQTYYDGKADRAAFEIVETNQQNIDLAARDIAESIAIEYVVGLVTTMCDDYLAVSAVCQVSLDQALLRAVTGADANDIELMRVSGREFLYLGAMNDLRLAYYRDLSPPEVDCETVHRITAGVVQAQYVVAPSLPMVDSKQRAPNVATRFPVLTTKGILSATAKIDASEWVNDFAARQPVVDCEKAHWSKFSLVAARGSPLLLPNVPGHTTCIRLFPHAVSTSSLLVVGTNQGQIAVYLVPWTGMAPTLLSITPQLPRKLCSPILDVREAPTSALQLISVTLSGHVRVWQLATVASEPAHSTRMFPRDASRYEVLIPTCMFHINPLDTSMPVPLDPTGRATAAAATALAKQAAIKAGGKNARKKKEKKAELGETAFDESKAGTGGFFGTKKAPVQFDMFPSVAIFHPSLTMLGRSPSILVGTAGGDLVKFNMDYKIDALDAPIAFLPAFLNIEFVHPINSPETILQTSSGRKGNQVYRELFHFHKSRVILLTVVDRLSEVLFSMDEDQCVALWRYEKEAFMGMCWFRPAATGQLDLTLKTNTYVGDTPSLYSEPTAAMQTTMRVRQRYYDGSGALIEIYSPVKVGRQMIEYQCRTATYTTATIRAPPAAAGETTPRQGGSGISTPPARGPSPPRVPSPPRSPSAAQQAGAELVTEEVTERSWTGRFVREVAMQTRVEGTTLSADGTELAVAVSYRMAPAVAPGAGFESIPLSAYKNFVSVVSFHLASLDYQHPFPVLEMSPSDAFLSFSLSPILSETLTRVCIIHTRLSGLRVFSMETGEEIVVPGAFPFVPRLPSFDPAIFCACPSLRVLAMGGPQDARLAVYLFMHEDDGKDEEELKANIILTPDVLHALRKDFRELEGISTRTVLAAPIEIETPEQKAAKEAITDIIEEVFDRVMESILKHIEEERRLGFIADVFGQSEGLGRVRPTAWLGDAALSMAAQEDSDDEERAIMRMFQKTAPAQAIAEVEAELARVGLGAGAGAGAGVSAETGAAAAGGELLAAAAQPSSPSSPAAAKALAAAARALAAAEGRPVS